jgi:hypothetical protein
MKTTSILRWPTQEFPFYQRLWMYELRDPIIKETKVSVTERNHKPCEEWFITISDEDAMILKLRFPKIVFI